MIERTYIVTDRYDIDCDGFVTDDKQAARDYFETQSPRLQWRCEYETSGRVNKRSVEWYFLEYDEVNGERVINFKSYGYGDYLRERDSTYITALGRCNACGEDLAGFDSDNLCTCPNCGSAIVNS